MPRALVSASAFERALCQDWRTLQGGQQRAVTFLQASLARPSEKRAKTRRFLITFLSLPHLACLNNRRIGFMEFRGFGTFQNQGLALL
jgi:hypothetical protein